MTVAGIVGVRFSRNGRVEYCDPAGFDLSPGDAVVVDTESGPREGQVVIAPAQVVQSDLRGPMDAVLSKKVEAET